MTAADAVPAPGPVVDRRAARVLLVDAAGRLLLFQGCDPVAREAGSWWFTPGGGIDEGETARESAVRELVEETGLVLRAEDLGEVVLERQTEFTLAGTRYRQSEEFFLARVDALDVDTGGFSDFERDFVLGHRWWGRDELRRTPDVVYPEALADLLDRLVA